MFWVLLYVITVLQFSILRIPEIIIPRKTLCFQPDANFPIIQLVSVKDVFFFLHADSHLKKGRTWGTSGPGTVVVLRTYLIHDSKFAEVGHQIFNHGPQN